MMTQKDIKRSIIIIIVKEKIRFNRNKTTGICYFLWILKSIKVIKLVFLIGIVKNVSLFKGGRRKKTIWKEYS